VSRIVDDKGAVGGRESGAALAGERFSEVGRMFILSAKLIVLN
jgi:hypothetical protein